MFLLSKEKKLSLNTPVIMGILNTTPDSFYGKSRVNSEQQAIDEGLVHIRNQFLFA